MIANVRVSTVRARTAAGSQEAQARQNRGRHCPPPQPRSGVQQRVSSDPAVPSLRASAASGGAQLLQEAILAAPEPPVVAGPAPFETKQWSWRGHSITYTVAGSGPPCLMVHGFGASSGHWRKNVPFLAQTHKVFAIDLLGFGRSDKPLIAYSIDLWRDLVLDFVAEFAEQPAVLVGNSIGSLTCLAASAADTAGRISGLVLINCAGGMNNKAAADDWRLKLAYPLLMLLDFLLARRRIAQYFFDKFRDPKNLKAVLARVYGDPALVDDALVDMIYTPSTETGALEAFVSIMTGPPGRRPELEMETVKGPLLVLWGSKDPCTPVDGPIGQWFTKLPQSRPNTEFHLLPGVGHCPQDANPQLVNGHLEQWLSKHHPGS